MFSKEETKQTKRRKTVSVIVPVFNEKKTVAGVVEALLKSDLIEIDEIICVNDGSTDSSLAILEKFKNKIELIDFKKNRGKGFALAAGIKKAKGEVVIFVDADLLNLTDIYIKALLKPILENEAKAVLGYLKREQWYLPNVFIQLTGERAYYRKDLIPYLGEMEKTRFGVEVFLNGIFSEKETKKVPLEKLKVVYKHGKYSPSEAFKGYLREAVEIAQELSKREISLPEDYHMIAELSKVMKFKELENKVDEIENKIAERFLKKYLSLEAFKGYLREIVEIAQELSEREILLPEGYHMIAELSKVMKFKELENKVGEIKNKIAKRFLKKYIMTIFYYIIKLRGGRN